MQPRSILKNKPQAHRNVIKAKNNSRAHGDHSNADHGLEDGGRWKGWKKKQRQERRKSKITSNEESSIFIINILSFGGSKAVNVKMKDGKFSF